MTRLLPLVLCAAIAGCSTPQAARPGPTRKIDRPAGKPAAPKPAAQPPAAGAPRYVEGLEKPDQSRFAGDRRWTERMARHADQRRAAVETLAARLGLVHDDRKQTVYFRVRDLQSGQSDAADWGRLDWTVVDGRRRPLVTLHPQPVLAGRVTLRECVTFQMTRAALLLRMGAEYYQLPEWLRLGAACYAAGLGPTLIDRRLAEIAASAAEPASLVAGFDDAQAAREDKLLLGWLALSWIESNHGVAALKSFVDRVAAGRTSPARAVQSALKLPWERFAQEVQQFGRRLVAERSQGLLPPHRQALKHYVAGRDTRAVGELLELLRRHPHGYLAGNMRYRTGRAYFRRRAYEEAHAQFSRVWLDHPRHCPYVDGALYWAARCRLAQQRRLEALAHLETLRLQFPRSERLREALMLSGGLLAEKGDHAAARERYLELQQHFPRHADASRAMLELGRLAFSRRAYARARGWAERLLAVKGAPAGEARGLLDQVRKAERAPLPPALEQEIQSLAQHLAPPALPERTRAALARLQEIGPAAAPALGKLLAGAGPALRERLVALLAGMADPRAAPYLVALLKQAPPAERKKLLGALIRLGLPVDLLPEMLESSGVPAALVAESKRLLGELSFHTTPAVREKLPELVRLLNHPAAAQRMRGVNQLNRLQDSGGMQALALLATGDPDPAIRREALEGLAVWGDRRAAAAFSAALGDTQPQIRLIGLQLVARYRLAPALPRVLPLLADPQPNVRAAAYQTAAALGDAKFVPRLVRGLRDPSAEVREAAIESLLLADRAAVVRALLPWAEQTTDTPLRGRLFRLLARLVGLNLGYYPEASPTQRRQMLARVRQWLRDRPQ